MAETRKWAEAEIGRPKLAVVGGWNKAYHNIVESIVEENIWRIQNSLANEVLPSANVTEQERLRKSWFHYTDRIDLIETCNRHKQCSKTYFAKTGWTTSGIEMDWKALDVVVARLSHNSKSDPEEKKRLNQLIHWTSLCGELCCPWRERHGYECKNQYASDPFAHTTYNLNEYRNLNNY